MNKKDARVRRARKTRVRIAEQRATRLVVSRSNSHIYAQIIAPTGDRYNLSLCEILPPDTVPPTVTAVTPVGGTTNVAKTSPVTATPPKFDLTSSPYYQSPQPTTLAGETTTTTLAGADVAVDGGVPLGAGLSSSAALECAVAAAASVASVRSVPAAPGTGGGDGDGPLVIAIGASTGGTSALRARLEA